MCLRWASFSSAFLRDALGLGFLSALADRFGLWGPFGTPNVSWECLTVLRIHAHDQLVCAGGNDPRAGDHRYGR